MEQGLPQKFGLIQFLFFAKAAKDYRNLSKVNLHLWGWQKEVEFSPQPFSQTGKYLNQARIH